VRFSSLMLFTAFAIIVLASLEEAIQASGPRLEGMGIEPGILKAHRPRNGIVLICGGNGTGRTRLQAAMIRSLIEDPNFRGKIIEVAAPIEYEFGSISGVSSIYSPGEIGRQVRSAAAAMRDAPRRKPKVIVSPGCRDRETMEVAVEGSATGHTVYSTVHTSSVVETVQRILAMVPQEERADRAVSLMQSLQLIINCALVPSLGRRQDMVAPRIEGGPRPSDVALHREDAARFLGELAGESGWRDQVAGSRAGPGIGRYI